jgi:hypothetical protein
MSRRDPQRYLREMGIDREVWLHGIETPKGHFTHKSVSEAAGGATKEDKGR